MEMSLQNTCLILILRGSKMTHLGHLPLLGCLSYLRKSKNRPLPLRDLHLNQKTTTTKNWNPLRRLRLLHKSYTIGQPDYPEGLESMLKEIGYNKNAIGGRLSARLLVSNVIYELRQGQLEQTKETNLPSHQDGQGGNTYLGPPFAEVGPGRSRL